MKKNPPDRVLIQLTPELAHPVFRQHHGTLSEKFL